MTEKVESYRIRNDIAGLLKFERELLEICSKELELYSATELIDLLRIRDDRNRCAHPTLNMDGDIYEPPAALARTHITNAVQHLLRRPPSRGKAAIEELINSLNSELFPSDNDGASKALSASPLSSGRSSLVMNFMVVILKELPLSEKLEGRRINYLNSIKFIRDNQRQYFIQVMENQFQKIVARLTDEKIPDLINLAKSVDTVWDYISDLDVAKVRKYVSTCKGRSIIILDTLEGFTPLKAVVNHRVERLSLEEIQEISWFHSDAIFDRAITLLSCSDNFAESNKIAKILTDNLWDLSVDHLERIIEIANTNDQVKGGHGFKEIIEEARIDPEIDNEKLDGMLSKHKIKH